MQFSVLCVGIGAESVFNKFGLQFVLFVRMQEAEIVKLWSELWKSRDDQSKAWGKINEMDFFLWTVFMDWVVEESLGIFYALNAAAV